MSKRQDHAETSCLHKKAYLTWGEAEHARKKTMRQVKRDAVRMDIYRCRHCHFYHVGNNYRARRD